MTWTACPSPVVADVIRWKEPVWAAPTKKRGKPDSIGEQLVTAEVMAVGEFLELQVQAIEILSIDDGATTAHGVKVGDRIRRKKTSIDRGDCHRHSPGGED